MIRKAAAYVSNGRIVQVRVDEKELPPLTIDDDAGTLVETIEAQGFFFRTSDPDSPLLASRIFAELALVDGKLSFRGREAGVMPFDIDGDA